MVPTGIAVVGAGPWGLTLTNAFARLPQARLRWICELEEERRVRASAAYPDSRVTDDLGEALGDPDVAAVVVAVDPARHHAVGLRALHAGKHLFVEKPLALSARDAEEIRAVAAARGRVLTVGHVLLHHSAVRQARQIAGSGRLGEPLTFVSRRATPGAPRRPGSAWWALAPHDVSLALSLFGELPTAVAATGRDWGRAGEDNAATAVLHFPGGRTAHIQVARFAAAKRREATIAGARATLTFNELAPADEALRLSTPEAGSIAVPCDRADALRAQCAEFATRAGCGDATGGNGAHAVDVVAVLEAGDRSMRAQGRPQSIAGATVAAGAVPPLARPPSFEAA